ncbi:MAG: glutathione S-transferase family protein [Deltaproteobacteria bacterium]|nr:MAG: glutathione S-transferase family protein [Deltaproteobacteria bacterium]
MSLTLYTFGSAWKTPDASPFCIKLHTYLRMAGISYEQAIGNPQQAPKSKLPYIEENGTFLSDSHLIIQHLESTRSISLDDHLTPEQHAIARAYRGMLEESFYFIVVYFRWIPQETWKQYKPVLQSSIQKAGAPGFLVPLLLPIIRRSVRKDLHSQGTSRHTPEVLTEMAQSQLDSVSTYLGDKTFFFGEQPSTLDATVFAMLSSLLGSELNSPVREYAQSLPNLVRYHDHILTTHFPELAEG